MRCVMQTAALAAASFAAYGQTAVHPCQLEAEAAVRTACLLKAFPAVAPATPTPAAPGATSSETEDKKRHGPTVYLHNSANVTDFGKLDLGDDGAQFSGTRSGGKTLSAVDLGAVVVFSAINARGWQPFAYAAWSREEAPDETSDKRTIGLGIQGDVTPGDTTGRQHDDLKIYMSANLARRVDIHGPNDATQLGMKLDFVKANWAAPLPGVLGFIPHVGFVVEHRDAGNGATSDGTWSTVYAGSKFVYKLPIANLKGFGFTGLARWHGDVSAPGDNDKRHGWFGKLKATYDLYRDASSSVKPSLYVSRQAGTDFLSGTSKAKTQFGLQLTIN